MKGYREGAVLGLMAVAVWYIVKSRKALKDEAALRKMWIQETDERKVHVEREAGSLGYQISAIVLVIGSVIASYFDFRVCMTLLAATAVILAIRLIAGQIIERRYQ